MSSINPFGEFRNECEALLKKALDSLFHKASIPKIVLELPPSIEFGELASSLCFELAKQLGEKPRGLAERIANTISSMQFTMIKSVEAAGAGYINFHINYGKFADLVLESVRELDEEYGFVKIETPRKIIVEHTSVNPLHPIHIGQARNPVLGDAIARILRKRGHVISTHYYVDDVGRQTAIIAYGYQKLGKPRPKGKPDHFIGIIYTITSCLIEMERLKKEIENAENVSLNEEAEKLKRQLDDWLSIAVELKEKYPKLFNRLLDEVKRDENPEQTINELNRNYEKGEEKAKEIIREVAEQCLKGFRETLSRIGISFDSWDWESEFVWESHVKKTMEKLRETPYVFKCGNVLEFDAEKAAKDLNLKPALGLKEDYEIPSLTLVRADGTTLYTTRDIAYSIWKLDKAEKVINVIGMEQSLAQLQLKLALYALGYGKKAENLVHFAYNLVTLPSYKMTSRKGRYITFDQVLEEAVERAYKEVSTRSPHLSEEKKREIAEFVGTGAVKYALIEVDPSKPVIFTWERVLNFERNSAPYIQYTHARACSIIRKATSPPKKPEYKLLKQPIEHEIILMISRFPETFIDAAENLKPNLIAEYANLLADKFNTFYNALPVLKAQPPELSDARLALVDATRIVLRNALGLIGVKAPQKM
jgi:arginyl-tRNA synthetase